MKIPIAELQDAIDSAKQRGCEKLTLRHRELTFTIDMKPPAPVTPVANAQPTAKR